MIFKKQTKNPIIKHPHGQDTEDCLDQMTYPSIKFRPWNPPPPLAS